MAAKCETRAGITRGNEDVLPAFAQAADRVGRSRGNFPLSRRIRRSAARRGRMCESLRTDYPREAALARRQMGPVARSHTKPLGSFNPAIEWGHSCPGKTAGNVFNSVWVLRGDLHRSTFAMEAG